MLSETVTGLAALKTAFDIAKGIKEMSDATARNAAVIELQSQILSAQEKQMAMAQRVNDLEEKLAAFERWDAEKQRYELKYLARGFTAYILKHPERENATPQALCTNCYERGFKSILQSNGKANVHEHAFVCQSCKGVFACQSKQMDLLIKQVDVKPSG